MKSASRVGSFFSFKIVDYPNIGMSTPNCPPYISQGADKENLKRNMSFRWWSFPVFLWPRYLIQRWICKKKLDVSHSLWSKGQNKCETTSDAESSRLPWETRWREFRNMFRFDLLPFRNISTWFYFPCCLNLPWVNILTCLGLLYQIVSCSPESH